MATEDLQIHLDARDDLTRELKNTIKTVAKLEQALKDATDGTSDATQRDIDKLTRRLEGAQNKTKSLSGAIGGLDRNIDQLGGSADRAGDKIDRMGDAGGRTRKGFGALVTAGKGAAVAITAVATATAVATVGFSRLNTMVAQYEQNMLKSKQVFGAQLPALKRWARQHRDDFGGSTQDVLKYAAGLQDLIVPMGFQRKEATRMTKDMAGLVPVLTAWDMKGRSAGEITDILAAALTGEREALKSLGVTISEDAVKKQIALMKTQGTLTGTTEEQQSAQATLALMYAKTGDAQKVYAKNSDTIARKNQSMKADIAQLRDNGLSVLVSAWHRLGAAMSEVGGGNPVKALAKFVRQNKDMIVSFILRVASGFAKWLSMWLKFESAVVAGAGYVVGGIASLLQVMAFIDPSMQGAADKADALAVGLGQTAKAMGDASEKADKASSSLNDQADAASNAQGRIDAMRAALKGLTKEQKKQARATFRNTSSAVPSYVVPTGDTSTPMGVGPGLGAAGLAAAHAAFSGSIGGHRITSGIRSWGLGSARSDHLRGRAMDVKGPHLGSYANAVRAAGGYAAMHGSGADRHLHAVPRTHRPEPVMAGGDTLHAEVHFHGGATRPFDARQAVISGLRAAERSKRQRGK